MNNFRDIFDRLKLFYGVKSDKKVAECLNINYNTVKTWSNRKKVAMEALLDAVQNETIDINWLLTGKGEMHLKESASVATSNHIVSGNNNIVGNGNGNININTEKFNHKEDIKDIIELLEFAPAGFLTIIKAKLIAFREMSHF